MKFVSNNVSQMMGRRVLQVKQNSPHIFFIGGVVGVVTSTILACRATLKLDKTVDEIKNDLLTVQDLKKEGHTEHSKEIYTDEQYYKDLMYVYGKATIKIGRLYGPSVLLGSASIASLTGSHIQLTRRNSALTATLASVMHAYEQYRLRVRDEVGYERELELHRSIENEVQEIDGKKQTVKVLTDPNGLSPYARFFDEANHNFQPNAEHNRIFLECVQRYSNDMLRTRSYIYLNEVYDSLGMDRSKAGAVVGWMVDGDGDGYVDFGIYQINNVKFVNGAERVVLLDFNVDGVIQSKINEREY